MVATTPEQVILLSLKSVYAQRIFSGEKKVEFRKTRPLRGVSHVLVYETQPVGRVTGVFEVLSIVEDKPSSLWRQYSEVAGIDKSGFNKYYANSAKAVGLRIGKTTQFERSFPLTKVVKGGTPPQSYRYVDAGRLGHILP